MASLLVRLLQFSGRKIKIGLLFASAPRIDKNSCQNINFHATHQSSYHCHLPDKENYGKDNTHIKAILKLALVRHDLTPVTL